MQSNDFRYNLSYLPIPKLCKAGCETARMTAASGLSGFPPLDGSRSKALQQHDFIDLIRVSLQVFGKYYVYLSPWQLHLQFKKVEMVLCISFSSSRCPMLPNQRPWTNTGRLPVAQAHQVPLLQATGRYMQISPMRLNSRRSKPGPPLQ